MHRTGFIKSMRIIYLMIISRLLFSGAALSAFGTEESRYLTSNKAASESLIFLPSSGLLIGGSLYGSNKAGYAVITERLIDLDIMRYGNFTAAMEINESLIFKKTDSNFIEPFMIRYVMDFGSLRWEFDNYIIVFYFDHICNNIYNKNKTDPQQLRWYGRGIRLESKGIRPGYKNRGINFNSAKYMEFLNIFNYRFSAGKSINTREFKYDYMLSGILRYDFFRYADSVFYIEGSFVSLIDEDMRVNRSVETGLRLHLENADITAYGAYGYSYDVDLYKGLSTHFYYFGLRMESLLRGIAPEQYNYKSEKLSSFFPEIHFYGNYGKYLYDENLNFNSDFAIDLNIIELRGISFFLRNGYMHNSLRENSGMFPRYIRYYGESGFLYRVSEGYLFAESGYKYTRFDEGNNYDGSTGIYHLIFLRLMSGGMKIGYKDRNSDLSNKGIPLFTGNFHWLISLGKVFRKKYYDFNSEFEIRVRWDICSVVRTTPYLESSIRLISITERKGEYSIESGLRFHLGHSMMIFYRYTDRSYTDPAEGIYSGSHLAGIRVEI